MQERWKAFYRPNKETVEICMMLPTIALREVRHGMFAGRTREVGITMSERINLTSESWDCNKTAAIVAHCSVNGSWSRFNKIRMRHPTEVWELLDRYATDSNLQSHLGTRQSKGT